MKSFSKFFKALSDPTRHKILRILRFKDMTVGDVAKRVGISQPSASHHLSILENAGLVVKERKGQFVIYSYRFRIMLKKWADFIKSLSKTVDSYKITKERK